MTLVLIAMDVIIVDDCAWARATKNEKMKNFIVIDANCEKLKEGIVKGIQILLKTKKRRAL